MISRARGAERGAILLWVVLGIMVSAMILNVAALHWFYSEKAVRIRGLQDAALFEARGGLRMAAARLERSERVEPIVRSDEWGVLEVRQEEGRLVATFTFDLGDGLTVRRTASARWRRGPGVELFDWKED